MMVSQKCLKIRKKILFIAWKREWHRCEAINKSFLMMVSLLNLVLFWPSQKKNYVWVGNAHTWIEG